MGESASINVGVRNHIDSNHNRLPAGRQALTLNLILYPEPRLHHKGFGGQAGNLHGIATTGV